MANHYSLKLRHPTLDLSLIAQRIPLVVTRIWRFGDSRFTPDGVPLPGRYKDSYCIFKFPEKIESIKEAIYFVHNILLGDPGLMKDLMSPSFEKSIYCTLDGDGEVLAVPELKTLWSLDIKLEID
ncbi:hypothetical protein [Variovorax guangxiensis]|uniref:hypothetical protein n=1 Tax=Variovorax guangxiensis TaxID=1775474 RepID=UPI00285A9664|nr:hypothetical protein [Variovorax guangxiensis]MDR6853807.1 hypothetical protein [Variovorax guangxiensis]